MACRTLLRRKTQLDLLEQACRLGQIARISLPGRQTVSATARMTALDGGKLVLERAQGGASDAELADKPLDVYFEHESECYVFRTAAAESDDAGERSDESIRRLRLHMPLRVERARRRRTLRLDLTDGPVIEGIFTHVLDARRQFKARLINLNDGGVGVAALAADVAELYTGDLFWLEMRLPDDSESSEFVARLVHLRPVKHTNEIAMGWAFQPTDDGSTYDQYVRRLESLLLKAERSNLD